MIKPLAVGLSLILASASHSVSATATPSNSDALVLEDCFVDNLKSKALCGTVDVPENRQQPISETNKISLNVVVLPKYKEESKELPMMFLAGGPGQAATELVPVLDRTMYEVRQEHDIILVDQRGTGDSSPLECDAPEVEPLSFDDSNFDLESEVKECIEQFSNKHLPSYNTYDSIKDFEAVREALGHKQVHILGGSYGTRAGFAYLKLFPESIATAVLDSNAPMELVIGFFGKTSERAFELLVDDCNKHEQCAKAFPELKNDYLSLVATLDKGPIETELFHPVTGEKTKAVLTKSKVTEAMRTTLYDLGSRQMLPYMVNRAANGDYRFLAAFIGRSIDSERAPGGLYTGLTMNIICNEDMPRASQSDFDTDKQNYFNGEGGYSNFTDVCQHWPKWQAPADFAQPVTADVPVLLFSGEYDPVTPPAYGEMALKSLPNAKHVVIQNGSHVASIRQCVDSIKTFMQSGSFNDVDFSCADKPSVRMFFTDMNQLH